MRERFAHIGVGAGLAGPEALSPELREAVAAGQKEAHADLQQAVTKLTTSVGLFGDLETMTGHYRERALGAMGGIYGNSPEEALYPVYMVDGEGKRLDTGKHTYSVTFSADRLPPVDAFWSLTIYDGNNYLLVDNPIDRYLINSSMLPTFKRGDDGSLTILIQRDRPEGEMAANWLPGPDGVVNAVMRLYLPQAEALDGTWKNPPIMVTGTVK